MYCVHVVVGVLLLLPLLVQPFHSQKEKTLTTVFLCLRVLPKVSSPLLPGLGGATLRVEAARSVPNLVCFATHRQCEVQRRLSRFGAAAELCHFLPLGTKEKVVFASAVE